MIPLVTDNNEKVRRHLLREFGEYDECRGIFVPKWLTSFVVEIPLQTAEPDGNHCIPPGIYFVDDKMTSGIGPLGLVLFGRNANRFMSVTVGYTSEKRRTGTCVDWRGIKKYV